MTGTFQDLNYSFDGYSDTENFITIHGINSEAYARNISTVLRDYKIATLLFYQ
jgi:hypothetical protein